MKKIGVMFSMIALLAGCAKTEEDAGISSTGEIGRERSDSRVTEGTLTNRNLEAKVAVETDRGEAQVRIDAGKPADNTAQNQRDRDGTTLTPGDQGTTESDRTITQAIRKSIVVEKGEDQHSLNARNVKIITVNGEVTLRGVVDSQAEKNDLEARAKQVAGVTKVNNQLEVKSTAEAK